MRIRTMQGNTLIELMVVVGIIAITVGLVSLGTNLIRRERVLSTTRELLADLQKARMDAMTKDSRGFGIRLESSRSYVLFRFNDCNEDSVYNDDTCPGNAPEEADVIRKTVPASVVLRKTNPTKETGNDVRIFDRFGSPRHPTGGLGGITILVRNVTDAEHIRCISVSTNRIREARWNGAQCEEF